MYDIPPAITDIPQAAQSFPDCTRFGLNDWKRTGYGGPCPPIGSHRYFHKLYALDQVLGELNSPTKTELLAAMEGHVLAEAVLMGTYEKEGQGRK